jgi:predicted N-acetyltransferase YhbS
VDDDAIRNLQLEEFDGLMRFLERCYGASPGWFEREHPHRYRPTAEMCATAYVIERSGQIVSHVGLYPIEVIVHGISISIGGIGAVGTLPSARGEGYMTKLLCHVIHVMREQGYPLSWLGGDRQRYNAFGWERAGVTYDLKFSRRSLDRTGVEPVPVEARFPADAVDIVERFQRLAVCHVRRPNLALQLRKEELRIVTAEDGYAIVQGSLFGPLSILELVSASGQESGMIRALLDWTGRSEISWEIPAWEGERLARLMPCVKQWRAGGWQMYRVVDLTRLLALVKPILCRRAAPLRDFGLSIGIREHDRTDVATLCVRDGHVEVIPGRNAEQYVGWSSVEAARLLLGGPPIGAESEIPAELAALLPIPVHVPGLDHI